MTQIEFLKQVEPIINQYGFECALLVLTNPTTRKMQVVKMTPLDKLDKHTEGVFDAILMALTKQFAIERLPQSYNKDYQQPDKN